MATFWTILANFIHFRKNPISLLRSKVHNLSICCFDSVQKFLVSVQLGGNCTDRFEPMMVYDKERRVNGFLANEGNEALYIQLTSKIRSEGWNGLKGYFNAYINLDGPKKVGRNIPIQINPIRILPVQSW